MNADGTETAGTPSITFAKRGCCHMLDKHPSLKARIVQAIEVQSANGMFKSKFASKSRWHGLPIRECRVNDKGAGSVRVAFAVDKDNTEVLYISGTIQKQAFTAELERFLKGRA